METPEPQKGKTHELDASTIIRSWANTNPATRGIACVVIRSAHGKLWIAIDSRSSDFDWGEAEIETVYAESPTSRRGIAFVTRFDFGFVETQLQGNVNAGLLVLAAFHTFRDRSNRADYFSREFFYEVTS